MSEVRVRGPGDERALVDFLEERLDTSLFLLSNSETAGLEDHGGPLEGTYAASFEDGKMTAVAAHYWNGILIAQGGGGAVESVAKVAVTQSGRVLSGLIGPLAAVERARRALGADGRRAKKGDPEILYGLDLERLRMPALLDAPGMICRRPLVDEIELLVDWRVEYSAEALGEERTQGLRDQSRKGFAHLPGWVLLHDGRPVSYSAFNAKTHGVVQVGGVYTPPELRGRGYGRAVVAGSLRDARKEGNRRSILFTGRANVAAQRAYRALGYEPLADFALILFEAQDPAGS
jgi:ribosomal protein S18 acetylase RimI-like enzyme